MGKKNKIREDWSRRKVTLCKTYLKMNNRTPKIILSVATSRKNESELVCENEADDDHGNYQGLPHSNTYVIRSWRQAKGPENKQTNTSLEQDV